MMIPKFVWRGTSIAKTILKVNNRVLVSRDLAGLCSNPHSGTGGERATWASRTDPKLAPRKYDQPMWAEVQKPSNKGRLASHVWCWSSWRSIDRKRKGTGTKSQDLRYYVDWSIDFNVK